eukprot:TRINITY_DN5281_c0_g2_i1.p1 TRINITY_DN5281_c0_g2~~TRINITY_DN5281_c0_g2_i1.p1  ORF type:complete len:243 (+),score=30.77 TRINITY_DN5281_c0_g2_i1:61-729(+)
MCIRDSINAEYMGKDYKYCSRSNKFIMVMIMTFHTYQVPANTSESLHIHRNAGGFDRNSIDPGMMNNRLSREEINTLVENLNEFWKKSVCYTLGSLGARILIMVVAILLYFGLRNHMRRQVLDTVLILFSIPFFVYFFYHVYKLVQEHTNRLQQLISKENDRILHHRNLHLILGPRNQYLILHLNYVPPPIELEFPQMQQETIHQVSTHVNQPFLVPAPQLH